MTEILVGDKPLKSYIFAALMHEEPRIKARGKHIKKAIDAALILERSFGYTITDWKLASEAMELPEGEKYVSAVDIHLRRR